MHPTPSKLTALMALAGLGLSLPGIVLATVTTRTEASPGSLHNVFGFDEVSARPAAMSRERDEALSRLVSLGLAPLPAAPEDRKPAPPTTEPRPAGLPPGGHGAGADENAFGDYSSAPGEDNGSDATEDLSTPPIEGSAADASAFGRPGDAAVASADAAADAMANSLALVAVVDPPGTGEEPPLPTRQAPEPPIPTAARAPRTALDAYVEPWGHPVLTALPDFDVCRVDAEPPVAVEAKLAVEPGLDLDLDPGPGLDQDLGLGLGLDLGFDLSIEAMHQPFRTNATPTRADAEPTAAVPAVERAVAEPAITTAVDIDLGGIGIGTVPDIDLGRLAKVEAVSAVDLELELPAAKPAPAAALAAADSAPAKRGAAVLGIAIAEPVSETRLDRVRGGFSSPGGLEVSFGIERAVYVNGTLVTTTSLNVSGLGTATGPQSIASTAPAGIALVQNGAGNTFLSGSVSAASLGTVVQNTLNNQKIQTVTLINATVNSLQVVKSMNIGASLRGALIDSLRR